MRSRGGSEDEKPSSPLWMGTYGDMVTLLLVFFVLLFSFSTIDGQKWRSLVVALAGNTGVLELGSSLDTEPNDPLGQDPEKNYDENREPDDNDSTDCKTEDEDKLLEESDAFQKLFERIKAYVETSELSGHLELVKGDFEILIRFQDNVIFDSGKADIKEQAFEILGGISIILLNHQEELDGIRIEGHTDNVPIRNARFPSNWELSTSRAVQVLRYFIEEKDLDPRKLSAVGYGEFHPIEPNETEAGRTINRRVDILIIKASGVVFKGEEGGL